MPKWRLSSVTQQRLQSTDENPNNWGYDHYEINNRIEENEYDYDEALYFFLINLDHNKTYNMDTLIQCGRQYEDYADFLKQNGYENSEDFKKTMKKKKEKGKVFVTNRNNAKGLEFPIVICIFRSIFDQAANHIR